MHWNYRIVRKRSEHIFKDKITTHYDYFLVEAYYDNNGKVGMISSESTSLYGENVEDLADGFVKMKAAFYKPILDYHLIPEPGYQESEDSFTVAMNSEDLFNKLEEADDDDLNAVNEEELDKYDKEVEETRVQKENLYKHLIREFVYDLKPGQIKLEEFYIKD